MLFQHVKGRWKALAGVAAACAFAGLVTIQLAESTIAKREAKIIPIGEVPAMPVGLVLGCRPALSDGRPNLFFKNRIQRAAELFHSQKVSLLLVSGDNSRKDYDEPTAMRDALVRQGVPLERIVIDYAGFSTLDSVVRAQQVFGLNEFIVVTQRDHAMRAIYIAEAHGIRAVGVAADEVAFRYAFRTKLREKIARVRTILDVKVLGRKPRFSGPQEHITAIFH